MDQAASPLPPPSKQPFQFTLRQLMAAMGYVCILAAAINYLGFGRGVLAIVPISSIALAINFYRKRDIPRANTALVLGGVITLLFLPALQRKEVPYSIGRCRSNLRNLSLALQQYHNVYSSFPPAYVADANGKPMHSWRVLILPYIEQKNLYDLYRFDEPWDGPNNSALAATARRPWLYECPKSRILGETSYVAVTGPQTMWPDEKSRKLTDVKDGLNNTILLVEVHNSGIHWMEPRDLDISQMPMAINPPRGLGISSGHSEGAHVVFADGTEKHLLNNLSAQSLRAMLTIAGGEKVKQP